MKPNARACLWIMTPAIAAWVLYARTLPFPALLLDDPIYLTQNPHVLPGLTWTGIAKAFGFGHLSWNPLVFLSWMTEVQFFGHDVRVHRFVNALLHAINAALVTLIAWRSLGSRPLAAAAGLVFAIHPLNVEPVVWLSARKDTLSGAFALSTVLLYLRYAQRPSLARYLAVALAMSLGLMAKGSLVTLPVLLGALDLWPLRRWPTTPPTRLIAEKLPLLALSAAAIVLNLQCTAGVVESTGTAQPLQAATGWAHYLLRFIAPLGLAASYDPTTPIPPSTWGPALGITLFALIASLMSYRPWLTAGAAWYAAALLPTVGPLRNNPELTADRFAYLPMLGLILAAGEALRLAMGGSSIPMRRGLVTAGLLWLAAIGSLGWRQAGYWCDEPRLWARALEVKPGNAFAHNRAAVAELARGKIQAADAHLAAALAAHPGYAHALRLRCHTALALHRDDEGLKLYDELRRHDGDVVFDAIAVGSPADGRVYNNLGIALARRGRYPEAQRAYQRAITLTPRDPAVRHNLARASLKAGDPAAAEAALLLAIDQGAADALTHGLLGIALQQRGLHERAIASLEAALRLNPQWSEGPGLITQSREALRQTAPR